MDFLIPYTKEITFDSKIACVESISLEHEISINEEEILGNFIVSGEYKTHELSVNKETFNNTIPFSIDLPSNIDKETINFEITDFTYEIVGDDTLKVIIEVNLKGKELDIKEDLVEEQLERESEIFQEPEDVSTDIIEQIPDEIPVREEVKDDEYITYHIHIYKEDENLESICSKYKSNMNILKEYNDISNLKNNDKLLIPEEDE